MSDAHPKDPVEIERLRQSLLKDYPDLGRTTWTWEQLDAFEREADGHIDDCDECQKALESTPPDDDSPYYCPVGESLTERYGDASLEYSWQPDFPKQDDPRWKL